MTIGVYMIEHVATGRSYVGKSVDVQRRIRAHFAPSKHERSVSHIHRAIARHGRDAFKAIVLEDCVDDETARARESLWIRELNTRAPHGFNLTDGGDGVPGYVPSETARQRMSVARTGRKHADATRAKMSASLVGNKRVTGNRHTDEARAKMSAACLGRAHTDEARAKNAAAHLGRKHSEAALVKMRARRPSEATRAKLRAAHLGRKHSEETLEKMRAAQQNRRRAEKE